MPHRPHPKMFSKVGLVISTAAGAGTKVMFQIMRMSQKANNWNPTDKKYWLENGWIDTIKPW